MYAICRIAGLHNGSTNEILDEWDGMDWSFLAHGKSTPPGSDAMEKIKNVLDKTFVPRYHRRVNSLRLLRASYLVASWPDGLSTAGFVFPQPCGT